MYILYYIIYHIEAFLIRPIDQILELPFFFFFMYVQYTDSILIFVKQMVFWPQRRASMIPDSDQWPKC